MRTFQDREGRTWTATVRERPGPDYKGRFHLEIQPGEGGKGVPLIDIRWNNERTAQRTLDTMSEIELRRRLRQALGRGSRTAVAE